MVRLLAKICPLHIRVLDNLVWRALSNFFASIQNDDTLRKAHHGTHYVLYHDHSNTAIITPTAGEILLTLEGETIGLIGKKPEEIVDLGVALVPEGRRLFPSLSVEENLILGAFRAAARARISENLEFVFEAFPALAARRSQAAGSMSGGEQQMVAVARAFMSNPSLLLIDEPSVGLAPILVSRMIAKIKELKELRNLTVLMAEQNFNQAIKIADRGYIIVHGQIEFEGKSTYELENNKMIKQYYLGA